MSACKRARRHNNGDNEEEGKGSAASWRQLSWPLAHRRRAVSTVGSHDCCGLPCNVCLWLIAQLDSSGAAVVSQVNISLAAGIQTVAPFLRMFSCLWELPPLSSARHHLPPAVDVVTQQYSSVHLPDRFGRVSQLVLAGSANPRCRDRCSCQHRRFSHQVTSSGMLTLRSAHPLPPAARQLPPQLIRFSCSAWRSADTLSVDRRRALLGRRTAGLWFSVQGGREGGRVWWSGCAHTRQWGAKGLSPSAQHAVQVSEVRPGTLQGSCPCAMSLHVYSSSSSSSSSSTPIPTYPPAATGHRPPPPHRSPPPPQMRSWQPPPAACVRCEPRARACAARRWAAREQACGPTGE